MALNKHSLTPPSAYYHWSCEFELRSWRGVLDITSCDKVCEWLATGRWFSPVSSTSKTDHHDITEILLKVALNTISQTNQTRVNLVTFEDNFQFLTILSSWRNLALSSNNHSLSPNNSTYKNIQSCSISPFCG